MIYEPRLGATGNWNPVEKNLVGALTEVAADMYQLHRVGIPVWLLLPATHRSKYNLTTQLDFMSYGTEAVPSPPFRKDTSKQLEISTHLQFPEVIFAGAVSDPSQYWQMVGFLADKTVYGIMAPKAVILSSLDTHLKSLCPRSGDGGVV